ncbi:hypothetical protein PAT3040_00260 [Paenibacillus agaridevorans]|uniref:Uncharacterized protein n=1 Tax=Paenibacillus agaridevorans TaxID=171404 RepID=A0A2R5EI61_9BACL|nr:hypothetical protein PAT3040_00260 [Paenibacillus agaridevorans]
MKYKRADASDVCPLFSFYARLEWEARDAVLTPRVLGTCPGSLLRLDYFPGTLAKFKGFLPYGGESSEPQIIWQKV